MCPIKLEELKIEHIVDFAKENTSFVAARENSNNHLRIFLIHYDTGTVYTRNGRADSWEELGIGIRDNLLGCIIAARNSVPVYRLKTQNSN